MELGGQTMLHCRKRAAAAAAAALAGWDFRKRHFIIVQRRVCVHAGASCLWPSCFTVGLVLPALN